MDPVTRTPSRGLLGVALLWALMAGCDTERDIALSGPTAQEGIVVESLELEQQLSGLDQRCAVRGTLRNDTGASQRVTLALRALDGGGTGIATAVATVDFVDAGARARFEARFRDGSDDGFLNDCDRVARVELADVTL